MTVSASFSASASFDRTLPVAVESSVPERTSLPAVGASFVFVMVRLNCASLVSSAAPATTTSETV